MVSKELATREFLLRFNVHVSSIRTNLAKISSELTWRASVHDGSKLDDEQLDRYIARHQEIHPLPYVSPERDEVEAKYEDLIEAHHNEYRHHPEHFEHGIDDMNLVDVIEMLCDWAAAGADIEKSLKLNSKKYCISPQLMTLLKNTIKDFGIKGV